MKFNLHYIICLFFLNALLVAQDDGGGLHHSKSNPMYKTRIGISPVIALYTNNKHHTSKSQQKMAFNISVKEEIRINKKSTSFLLIGAEYTYHGLNFNSYYFYDDSLKLYNGNMTAKYGLQLHELNIPIQIKQSFQRETNALVSAYVYAGYCYRIITNANLQVTNNGQETYNHSEKIKFKNPIFNSNDNSFLCFAGGVQKNTMKRHNAVYAELQFRYALSPFYFNKSFAPTSISINSHFLMLTVGFKI